MKKLFVAAVLLAAVAGLLSGCEYQGSVGGDVTTPHITANVTGTQPPVSTDAQQGRSGGGGSGQSAQDNQMGAGTGNGSDSGM